MDGTLRRITIISNGTRGDVQPYVAIALALRSTGAFETIRVATTKDLCPWVKSLGFDTAEIFGGCRKEIQSDPVVLKILGQGDAKAFFSYMTKRSLELGPSRVCRFVQELKTHPPDLLIAGTLTDYFAAYASFVFNIPVIHCKTFPIITTNSSRAALGFPTLPFGLHKFIMKELILKSQYASWKKLDEAASIMDEGKVVTAYVSQDMYIQESQAPSLPQLVMQPVVYKQHLYSDGKNSDLLKNFRFVGSVVIPCQEQEADEAGFGSETDRQAISNFLQLDPARKPVYCGWGSMICKSPQFMVNWIVRALQLSGQRGIVLSGWAELSMELLSTTTCSSAEIVKYAQDNILFVKDVPHEWLLPQMACTIHHGGQGTLAAALRAGVPTIVTPIFMDQFDSAHLVEKLGVGIGFEKKKLQDISSEKLASAITTVLENDSYREEAKVVEVQVKSQNGAEQVVKEVRSFWKDFVLSGRYDTQRTQVLLEAGYDTTGLPLDLVPKRNSSTTSSRMFSEVLSLLNHSHNILFALVMGIGFILMCLNVVEWSETLTSSVA